MIFFLNLNLTSRNVCCLKSPQRNVVFYTLLPLNLYFMRPLIREAAKKNVFFLEIFPKCGWVGWLIPKQCPNPYT